MCAATLTSMGDRLGTLSCHVPAAGRVSVVLSAGEAMDILPGEARVVLSNFAW